MDKFWWAANNKRFAQWLADNGAEIRPLTNPWEVLRFRLDGVVHVVYTNGKGRIAMQPLTVHLAQRFDARLAARPVDVAPPAVKPPARIQPSMPAAIVGWARNIIRRGKGLKSLLLSATTGPEHVPHCGCDAKPWESCNHTKGQS